MARFADQFVLCPETAVLDVGGTAHNWGMIPVDRRPHLTMINTLPITPNPAIPVDAILGDGCAMPFADRSFAIVFSNSTIEHVGDWERQQAFARQVRRVGRSYCVQTPNRWFPIEPHYWTPFVHWLPRRVQVRVLRRGTLWGLLTKPSPERCAMMVGHIRLLTPRELRRLFPEATIERERVLGLTKSVTAVYRPDGGRHQNSIPR